MARGRYKEWLTEDNLKRIQSWVRDGLSDVQVAKNMGISKTTFYDWLNKYPAISDVVKKGKQPVDFEVENALFRRAIGYDIEETNTVVTVNAKGEKVQKITKVKKHIPADATAAIFWLKNRQPEKWKKLHPIYEAKTDAEIAKLKSEIKKLEAEAIELERANVLEDDTVIITDEWLAEQEILPK